MAIVATRLANRTVWTAVLAALLSLMAIMPLVARAQDATPAAGGPTPYTPPADAADLEG